jgi:hypothetical protein
VGRYPDGLSFHRLRQLSVTKKKGTGRAIKKRRKDLYAKIIISSTCGTSIDFSRGRVTAKSALQSAMAPPWQFWSVTLRIPIPDGAIHPARHRRARTGERRTSCSRAGMVKRTQRQAGLERSAALWRRAPAAIPSRNTLRRCGPTQAEDLCMPADVAGTEGSTVRGTAGVPASGRRNGLDAARFHTKRLDAEGNRGTGSLHPPKEIPL